MIRQILLIALIGATSLFAKETLTLTPPPSVSSATTETSTEEDTLSQSRADQSTLPTGSAFEIGNAYYNQLQFDSAEVYYVQALKEQGDNSAILYNLSNAVYRQYRLGEAILLLEKAKLYNPKDAEILNNLRYLYTQTVDETAPEAEGTFLSFLSGAHSFISLKNQLYLLIALGFIFLGVFTLILFNKRVRTHGMYGAMIVLGTIAVVMSSVGYKVYHRQNDRFGIILTESIEAKNEPRGTTLIFTLHEGTKIQVIKSREQWSFIKLPSGSAGWIPQESMGAIQ